MDEQQNPKWSTRRAGRGGVGGGGGGDGGNVFLDRYVVGNMRRCRETLKNCMASAWREGVSKASTRSGRYP